MNVGCWLLVVGCWLLVVGYWLLVVCCWLFVVESDRILTSYTFDLTNHVLSSQFIDNPNRDKLYTFIAYRVKDSDSSPVSLIQQHKTKGVN